MITIQIAYTKYQSNIANLRLIHIGSIFFCINPNFYCMWALSLARIILAFDLGQILAADAFVTFVTFDGLEVVYTLILTNSVKSGRGFKLNWNSPYTIWEAVSKSCALFTLWSKQSILYASPFWLTSCLVLNVTQSANWTYSETCLLRPPLLQDLLPMINSVMCFNEDWKYQFILANKFCLLELINEL